MTPENEPSRATVLCAICGGIAAYKTVDVVSRLQKQGLDVHVVMSPAACEFVQPLTFQALTGRKVITRLFPAPDAEAREEIYPHLYPATQCDLFVVMPATADIVGKIANGFGDDLVSANALALKQDCVRVFCPAMNTHMWSQKSVQASVQRMEELGWIQVGPDAGALACGAEGEGRMAEPDTIFEALESALQHRGALRGRRVLVLSGPTHEHLDPIRFIGNPSSGKMGRAIAQEALARGAQVDFVTGPVDESRVPRHAACRVYRVTGAEEMLTTAKKLFAQADIVVFAAAVADYRPVSREDRKGPKRTEAFELELEPTPDIAATLCAGKKAGQVAVGFSLQDADAESRARDKLEGKKLDAIVLNSPEAMGADAASYRFLAAGAADSIVDWGGLSKKACARRLIDECEYRLKKPGP